jgi:hypothetical protein
MIFFLSDPKTIKITNLPCLEMNNKTVSIYLQPHSQFEVNATVIV